jgi:predicted nucleotidyltransferase
MPAGVAGLLSQLRERLAARDDLAGIYLYGSLVTGDFSPAASDIDVVVLLREEPAPAAVRELEQLHQSLRSADPAGQLHCLYAGAEHAADAARLCTYWFGTRMTQWQMKLLTQAELASAGIALHGPWPPPGIRPVPVEALRAAVHAELTGYHRRTVRRRMRWLDDSEVDHALVILPRAEALLISGELITKGTAIARLADFGVPAWLAAEISDRRAGHGASQSRTAKLRRAVTARRIMRAGVERLIRLDPAG